jgi:hypothetical protein
MHYNPILATVQLHNTGAHLSCFGSMVELFANDISFGSIINQGVGVAKDQRKRTLDKILVILGIV